MSHEKRVFSEVIEGSGAVNQSQWVPPFFIWFGTWWWVEPLGGLRQKVLVSGAGDCPDNHLAVGGRRCRTDLSIEPNAQGRLAIECFFSLLSPKSAKLSNFPQRAASWEISRKRVGGNSFFFFVQGEEDGRGRIFDKWQGS